MGTLLAVLQVAGLKLVLDALAVAVVSGQVYGVAVYFSEFNLSLLQAFCLTLFQAYQVCQAVWMVCLGCHAACKLVGS